MIVNVQIFAFSFQNFTCLVTYIWTKVMENHLKCKNFKKKFAYHSNCEKMNSIQTCRFKKTFVMKIILANDRSTVFEKLKLPKYKTTTPYSTCSWAQSPTCWQHCPSEIGWTWDWTTRRLVQLVWCVHSRCRTGAGNQTNQLLKHTSGLQV